MKSRFVHHIVAPAEFSDKSRMSEYKVGDKRGFIGIETEF